MLDSKKQFIEIIQHGLLESYDESVANILRLPDAPCNEILGKAISLLQKDPFNLLLLKKKKVKKPKRKQEEFRDSGSALSKKPNEEVAKLTSCEEQKTELLPKEQICESLLARKRLVLYDGI